MQPTQLITASDLVARLGLTANLNEEKAFNQYVLDAQEFDIRPFLGEELYLDLLDDFAASPSLSTYDALFNGGRYTDGTRTRENPGVIEVLCRFAFARYVENSGTHSTKHGLVVKKTEWSEPVSEKTLQRKMQAARSAAVALQERVKKYLDVNATDYPLYRGASKRRRGSMRITAVGGNSRRRRDEDCSNDCTDVRTVIDSSCGDDYVNSGYVE